MSHVQGHIIDPPQSPGTLRPFQSGQPCIDIIVRIPEIYKKNGHWQHQIIGFHPVHDDVAGTVSGEDVVDWVYHKTAEDLFVNDSTLNIVGIAKLEELCRYKPDLPKIKTLVSRSKLAVHYKDVINRSIDFVKTPAFNKFYLKSDKVTLRSGDEVVEKIREYIIYGSF
jgi:hypothetical protein